MTMAIPKIPVGKTIEQAIDYLTLNFSFITRAISDFLETGIDALVTGLMFFPAWVLILVFAGISWWIAGRKAGILTLLGFALILNLGLWGPTMSTLALVLIATLIAVAAGVPLGVLAAIFPGVHRIIMPVLDFMQTMPAFVYLIPAIPFFGLGPVSAIFSTVIFAMPPAIRLTCLGIEQVPLELIEAADSFGANRRQKLVKLQIPLAKPTIMAGINQTIMLSLSMVVIAAMIGARGLGGEVWKAIQRFEPGNGFEAGLGVVILAMALDRVTQKLGSRKKV